MLSRENPIRICVGLVVKSLRLLGNLYRLRKLQSQGLQCSHSTYINRKCTMIKPANINIGANCYIDGKLYALDRITIGDRTVVGEDVFLCTGSHDIDSVNFKLVTKPISIGSFVWIASGATVLPGVNIGDCAVVGAMAVVAKNIPAGAVAVGNPARIIRTGRACPTEFDPISLATIDWHTSFNRLRDSLRRKKK